METDIRIRPLDALTESILPRYILGDKRGNDKEIRIPLNPYCALGDTPPRVEAVYTSIAILRDQYILEFQGVVVE